MELLVYGGITTMRDSDIMRHEIYFTYSSTEALLQSESQNTFFSTATLVYARPLFKLKSVPIVRSTKKSM